MSNSKLDSQANNNTRKKFQLLQCGQFSLLLHHAMEPADGRKMYQEEKNVPQQISTDIIHLPEICASVKAYKVG